ncbi:hypothetical protein PVAP13_7KG038763 [Panicum virgatum]|uniref:Uncharacterized protein n=1 Tax=Panicum virgatum TaxID=38727 RepID=A0A8T0QDQ0_PANVG|nr:hypothetical protein PVAP13_7KG038763 [Panicum virgatum]
MRRIVHYLMATSFVFLVMISTNSPSCQAGLGPWCKPRPPCFPATNEDYCTKEICPHVCEMNEIVSNGAYCKKPKKGGEPIWLCCCPPAR